MSRKNSKQRTAYSVQKKQKPFVWVEIDLNHLRHNLRVLRKMAGSSGAELLAIVKADAYGHGMPAVTQTLYGEGVRFFGVANLDEATQLRAICPDAKILVLGSFHKEQVGEYVRHRIRPTLSSIEDLKIFEKAPASDSAYPVHVKVDTGMGRLGVWHEEALRFFERIRDSQRVVIEGVYTHFSSADEENDGYVQLQTHRFETVLEKIRSMGISPRFAHAANSLAILRFRNPALNLVRPGILLYGLNPWKPEMPLRDFKPVLSLKSRISFLKEVGVDQPLSYGRLYQTSRNTRIATVPVGYSHGYRVGFSNKSQVLVRGKRCPVVGRVTMDQMLVDVGKVPNVRRWDAVTLLGEEGGQRISAEELAGWISTIPYEIVCSIHSRIPRFYKGLLKDYRAPKPAQHART